tara:strand:+ start:1928 stop:2092 length:165 start_codon:yes stop_codon:yes gene_type:complete
VQLLVAAGVDVNAVNKRDYTALMKASEFGHTEIDRALLNGGDAAAREEWWKLTF